MKLNKPSYGVFMVDVFASSVGIFILVSLLYIIESAKATSDEVMAEKFKTLVKRDKVPVDRYSLPASQDPLHDWGVRARHARDNEEALVILLRDKVMLYHTGETLDKEQVVDSDAIRRYYEKYTKNRRLVLEIHYHDAYHYLKAKINESLPPDVRLWIHWAYNAGNIANPNPVFGPNNTARVNMSRGTAPFDPDAEQNPLAVGSSTAPFDSTGNGTNAFGSETGDGSGGGMSEQQGEGSEGGAYEGDGSEGDGSQAGGSPQGSEDGQQGDSSGESGDSAFSLDGEGDEQGEGALQQAVAEQMDALASAAEIVEQLMSAIEPPEDSQPTPEQTDEQQNEQSNQNGQSSGGSGSSGSNTSENSTADGNQQNNQEQDSAEPNETQNPVQSSDESTHQALPTEQQAQVHIQKNVFISVPLFSPINDFQLDVQVPGFDNKRYAVNAVRMQLQTQPAEQSTGTVIDLTHGDAIIPESSKGAPGWFKVKIVKVAQPNRPLSGWVYGGVFKGILMLPLYENKVQSIATENERYWFKHENHDIEGFNTQAESNEP